MLGPSYGAYLGFHEHLFINIYYSVYSSILGILKDMSVINTVLALKVYHVAGEKNIQYCETTQLRGNM